MLEDLSIKDFAIIESENIEFNSGFTVLSGETGAGKSILIGALSFLVGGKADVSVIRSGSHEASVAGTFFLGTDNSQAANWLNEHGIESENGRILLRRVLKESGKSGAWIGGVPVTRADLADFSSFLIDIHGQHEHQSLMKVSEHRKFLDSRAGLNDKVQAFTLLYTTLVEKRKVLLELNSSDAERARKIDMLKFAVQEISEAKLKENEDVSLEEEESRLASYEKLYSDIEAVRQLLDGGENSCVSLLKKARRESAHAASMDKSLDALDSRMENSFYELSDIASEFDTYFSNLVYDPNHLDEVQQRLSLINNLKKKYASSINAPLGEVISYYKQACESLEKLDVGQHNKDLLEQEILELEKQVYICAKEISVRRKEVSLELGKEVETLLGALGMKNAHFAVSINDKPGTEIEQKCGPYGMDNVEFMISANLGSPMLPLAKFASGGELSRVMLALKSIFAQHDPISTMIFDEIDTGIGGEIAVQVGSHMKSLAQTKQIFCITHLASIAVYADNQIKISKGTEGGRTASSVHPVVGDERIREIARMLSGDDQTAQSLEHAKAMLEKFSGGF